jgi:hypothetical protein
MNYLGWCGPTTFFILKGDCEPCSVEDDAPKARYESRTLHKQTGEPLYTFTPIAICPTHLCRPRGLDAYWS